MKIVEMLAQLNGTAYAERCALDTPKNIRAARAAIRKAFDVQIAGLGFSIVEMLSICPTCWGMQPVQALEFLQKQMIPYYPLGVCKEPQ